MSGLKNLKKRRRIQVIALAGACVAAVLATLWFLPDTSFQYYRSPSEVAAAAPSERESFRMGGLIEAGTLVRNEGARVTFRVTDGGASIPLTYQGILPDLINEGQGMVALGRYVNGTFEATEIFAKHDETYMPKEVLDALKEQGVYVDPDGAPVTN
jgi:cytochrome c-type biogenesis protein CcmE